MVPNGIPNFQESFKVTGSMPVLFIGHGSPMNAIEDNEFSRTWHAVGQQLPAPKAILCISAHWETRGTLVTCMPQPRTIHDFGGFPRELYEAEYPAPGSPWLAEETKKSLRSIPVGFDDEWGLDHGAWSILKQMYPQANIPVVQLSLDLTRPTQYHYDLAKELAPLRQQGVLILGSGNMVSNLRRVVVRSNNFSDFNSPYGLDWAIEANDLFKKRIAARDHQALVQYQSLGAAVQLAVPTPEHYLPMLYILALQQENESITYFNDKLLAGSLAMTSMIIDRSPS
jgi:4,5-DOPA dioxygenase extradiol